MISREESNQVQLFWNYNGVYESEQRVTDWSIGCIEQRQKWSYASHTRWAATLAAHSVATGLQYPGQWLLISLKQMYYNLGGSSAKRFRVNPYTPPVGRQRHRAGSQWFITQLLDLNLRVSNYKSTTEVFLSLKPNTRFEPVFWTSPVELKKFSPNQKTTPQEHIDFHSWRRWTERRLRKLE